MKLGTLKLNLRPLSVDAPYQIYSARAVSVPSLGSVSHRQPRAVEGNAFSSIGDFLVLASLKGLDISWIKLVSCTQVLDVAASSIPARVCLKFAEQESQGISLRFEIRERGIGCGILQCVV